MCGNCGSLLEPKDGVCISCRVPVGKVEKPEFMDLAVWRRGRQKLGDGQLGWSVSDYELRKVQNKR